MTDTSKLDPATLRWVADEQAFEAERFYEWAREHGSDEWQCRSRGREYAMRAKRYRALATRIENKRKARK